VGAGIYGSLDEAVEKTISLRAFEQPGPDREIYNSITGYTTTFTGSYIQP